MDVQAKADEVQVTTVTNIAKVTFWKSYQDMFSQAMMMVSFFFLLFYIKEEADEIRICYYQHRGSPTPCCAISKVCNFRAQSFNAGRMSSRDLARMSSRDLAGTMSRSASSVAAAQGGVAAQSQAQGTKEVGHCGHCEAGEHRCFCHRKNFTYWSATKMYLKNYWWVAWPHLPSPPPFSHTHKR